MASLERQVPPLIEDYETIMRGKRELDPFFNMLREGRSGAARADPGKGDSMDSSERGSSVWITDKKSLGPFFNLFRVPSHEFSQVKKDGSSSSDSVRKVFMFRTT